MSAPRPPSMHASFMHAHASMMILAWMFFGSTGIVFARYGRSIRFGLRRQFLGKAIWFQSHRFLLSITPLLVLLGFIFILFYTGGQWANRQMSVFSFAHSILGGIIFGCVILQVWLALYRCHPHSRFRYIFNWSHRLIGLLAFVLFPPAVFLILFTLPNVKTTLMIIISIWTCWMMIVIAALERIEYLQRRAVSPMNDGAATINPNNYIHSNSRPDNESGTNPIVFKQQLITIRLVLFFFHTVISMTFSIAFIVVLCE